MQNINANNDSNVDIKWAFLVAESKLFMTVFFTSPCRDPIYEELALILVIILFMVCSSNKSFKLKRRYLAKYSWITPAEIATPQTDPMLRNRYKVDVAVA